MLLPPADPDLLALHLPAHGRGRGLAPPLARLLRRRPGSWDLPELPGFGGPLEPEGAVAEEQRQCAALLGAEHCWFGVNGASGLLQVALLALAAPGSRVLLPRNLHRSLLHACVLGQLEPVLYSLPFDPATGLWLPPTPQLLEQALAAARAGGPLAAVAVVSPTYQGLAADLPALVAVAHAAGLPLLVDQAHGAAEAVAAGADLVVLSCQKSGGGLAQSAVLLAQGGRCSVEAIERALLWLQTSSPSALLFASAAASLRHGRSAAGLAQRRRALALARRLRRRCRSLDLPLLASQDPLRLVLPTAATGHQRGGGRCLAAGAGGDRGAGGARQPHLLSGSGASGRGGAAVASGAVRPAPGPGRCAAAALQSPASGGGGTTGDAGGPGLAGRRRARAPGGGGGPDRCGAPLPLSPRDSTADSGRAHRSGPGPLAAAATAPLARPDR